jgi:hypothetical protein
MYALAQVQRLCVCERALKLMHSELRSPTEVDHRTFCQKRNTAAAMHFNCVDVIVAPATYTHPVVPHGFRRGVLEVRIADWGAGYPGPR